VAKGPDAFRTISEAAEELNVPQHVLRFWETKFSFIRPMKRAGGRRFYRPGDIVILRGVQRLLHEEGYTIKGVQKLHKDEGLKRLAAIGSGEAAPRPTAGSPRGAPQMTSEARRRLTATLQELEVLKDHLDRLLHKS
jgi:DNA-binding transcriptional MerR regulator